MHFEPVQLQTLLVCMDDWINEVVMTTVMVITTPQVLVTRLAFQR